MNILAHPDNRDLIAWLARATEGAVTLLASDSFRSAAWPYTACGCHPEIVERIWDQIGGSLPAEARFVLCGRPVLVDPASGIVLAVGYGTSYILRLPQEVTSPGAVSSRHTWGDGTSTDLSQEIGHEWVFGAWLEDEGSWCQAVINGAESAPRA